MTKRLRYALIGAKSEKVVKQGLVLDKCASYVWIAEIQCSSGLGAHSGSDRIACREEEAMSMEWDQALQIVSLLN